MREIIIGTTNPAKVEQIKSVLQSLGLVVRGISEGTVLPEVKEDGKTAQENARKKALTYANFLRQNVLSMDNALYLDGLELEEQPGINVRRIKSSTKEKPTDEELLTHYSDLINRLGDRISGRWEFAVCFAKPTGEVYETTIISPRIFTSQVSLSIVPGYPLESIQINPKNGKYISEMNEEERTSFWQEVIGKELINFVRSVPFD